MESYSLFRLLSALNTFTWKEEKRGEILKNKIKILQYKEAKRRLEERVGHGEAKVSEPLLL
jgi:hypothetical protein